MIVLLSGLVVGSAFVTVDQVVYSPGDVRGTADRVVVSGAPSYPIDGDIQFATVRVRQATLFDTILRKRVDDTLQFVPYDEVYPDDDKATVDAANVTAMADSKTVASIVALNHLGLKVTYRGDGVEITDVADGYPADGVLRAGDVIVRAGGRRIRFVDDLHAVLESRHPGDTLKLVVERGPNDDEGTGSRRRLTVGLAKSDQGYPIMGIAVDNHDFHVDLPVDIELDSGKVTGPSAGLAWTLAIVDEMTPEDLTRGDTVAATGTIDPSGAVGPIGGLPQKTAAVRRAGTELFLVPDAQPDDQLREARAVAGDEVELVQVGTLSEAIDAIEAAGE